MKIGDVSSWREMEPASTYLRARRTIAAADLKDVLRDSFGSAAERALSFRRIRWPSEERVVLGQKGGLGTLTLIGTCGTLWGD